MSGREPFGWVQVLLDKAASPKGKPMNPSEKFMRFAAECEHMAKFTRSPENRTVWIRMAERWMRCAQLYDRESAAVHSTSVARRHRPASHGWAH